MWKVGSGVLWLGLCSALGLVGCAADEEGFVGNEAYCDGLCGAAERCELVQNRATCFENCLDSTDARAAMSEQGGVTFGACVSELDCALLEDEAAFDACWQSAKEKTPVTPRTRSFCRVYTESVFECGYGYSMLECEHDYRMWGDEVLDLMTDCAGIDACADREMCQDMVFR